MSHPTTPVNYLTHGEVINAYYATLIDPSLGDAAWQVPILKQLVLVCGLNRDQEYFGAILSNALMTLSIEEREWFLSEYSIPGHVIDSMQDLPAWPEPRTVEAFPEATAEDLALYVEKLDRRLVMHAENQAARATKKGDRVSMAYTRKYEQAVTWSGMDQATQDAVDAEAVFPYLHEHAQARSVSVDAAATDILSKGVPWDTINARIEGQRERFQIAANQAADAEEVKTLYDTHAATITGLIDLLLGVAPEVVEE